MTIDVMGDRGVIPTYAYFVDVNYADKFGGTSASAPQVAGAATMVISHELKINYRPDLSAQQVKEVLYYSSDDNEAREWDDSLRYDPRFGWGRLNAMKALVAIARGDINKDGRIALTVIVHLVNYVFDKDRPATGCLGSDPGNCWTPTPHKGLGNANCDSWHSISVADVIYLTDFVFNNPPG